MNQPFLYLSKDVIQQCISMGEAIDLMKEAFSLLSSNQAHLPVRQNVAVPEVSGEFLVMPVCAPKLGHFALKTVGIHGQNPQQDLPLIHAMILLVDANTGRPQALMDGEWLTALRTGAASGLATDLLARQKASTAAIVGAGVQARTQLEAIAKVRSLSKVWVLNRHQDRGATFAAEMSDRLGLDVRFTPSPEVLREAAIICTATSGTKPLFASSHVAPGTHINAVGGYRADMQEVPAETVAQALVIVDQKQAALNEAGDILIPLRAGLFGPDHIQAELGTWLQSPSRKRPQDQITLFKSVGNAIQDLAVASCAYKNALKQGLGQKLPL